MIVIIGSGGGDDVTNGDDDVSGDMMSVVMSVVVVVDKSLNNEIEEYQKLLRIPVTSSCIHDVSGRTNCSNLNLERSLFIE